MKAICLRARGGPEALAYEKAPQPPPGEGEVLVRVPLPLDRPRPPSLPT